MVSVAADEKIADAVEHETECAENYAELVCEKMIVRVVIHVIVRVADMEERLNYFNNDRETERGEEDTADDHA